MKKIAGLVLLGVALLAGESLRAQNYSIDWYTIAGGGGTSSGGNFAVSGTIGQPAAGTMSGGNFSLTGGFWSLISAVQSPGAPYLTITLSGNHAVLSWPATAGFNLQDSASLMSGSWLPAFAALSTNNGTVSATVPAGSGYQFYRLHNP